MGAAGAGVDLEVGRAVEDLARRAAGHGHDQAELRPGVAVVQGRLFVPSSETHHGDVELWEIPQPLTRSGSVIAASPGTSDWSLWTLYRFSAFGFRAAAGSATPSSNPRLAASARSLMSVRWEVAELVFFWIESADSWFFLSSV